MFAAWLYEEAERGAGKADGTGGRKRFKSFKTFKWFKG